MISPVQTQQGAVYHNIDKQLPLVEDSFPRRQMERSPLFWKRMCRLVCQLSWSASWRKSSPGKVCLNGLERNRKTHLLSVRFEGLCSLNCYKLYKGTVISDCSYLYFPSLTSTFYSHQDCFSKLDTTILYIIPCVYTYIQEIYRFFLLAKPLVIAKSDLSIQSYQYVYPVFCDALCVSPRVPWKSVGLTPLTIGVGYSMLVTIYIFSLYQFKSKMKLHSKYLVDMTEC